MAKQMILNESGLMPYIRKDLCEKNLSLSIRIDPAKTPKDIKPKVKKVLSNKEKYQKMVDRNPLVDELRKRFDLQQDK